MPIVRRSCLLLLPVMVGLAVLAASVLSRSSTARALPEAGTDTLAATAQASVVSRLGSETISFTGTVTIERSDPRMEGGVEVVDTEIIALDLEGTSLTGPVEVRQSPTRASIGEIRSLQPPPDQFPASSFFDSFIEVIVPGSPAPVLTLHNEVPFHLVPTSGGSEVPLDAWPPTGVAYASEPDPCVPLLPQQPAEVCVTSLSVTLGDTTSTPTPTATSTPTAPGTPLPTATPPLTPPTATPPITPGVSRVRISPEHTEAGAEEPFSMSIMVDDATNLAAFEFELAFDPAVLTFVSAESGPFLGSTGRTVTCLGPSVDEEEGTAAFACVTTGSAPAPSGSGTLAEVTMSGSRAGESDLTFTRVALADPLGDVIPAQAEGGSVTVSPGETPTPTPTSTATPGPATETPAPTATSAPSDTPATPTPGPSAGATPTATAQSQVLSLPSTGANAPAAAPPDSLTAFLAAGLALCFGLGLCVVGVRQLRRP